MRTVYRIFIVLVITEVAGLANWPRPVSANPAAMPEPRAVEVNITLFHERLAPYGEWVKVDRWGWCWRPHVAIGWRPYTTGHWVFADECGWTWVADEEWGWAPFHYGRWYFDDSCGCWTWVPGSVWGPAWVAWRNGGGYCGWRPLPPECGWSSGTGLNCVGVDLALEPGHPCWSFCEERFMIEPRLREHLLLSARNVTYISRTRDVTRIEVDHDRIVNRSVDVRHVEEVTHRTVERVHIREVESVERLRESKSEPGEIAVYRPTIATAAAERDPVNRPREPLNITREDLEKRQQRELGELQSRHENERKMLEDLQKREIERPPEGSNADQIKRDHDAERKMLDEQHRREMDIQKRAHENERQHLPPPPRPQEPARPHKPGA